MREEGKCTAAKGSEARVCLGYLRNKMEKSVGGAEAMSRRQEHQRNEEFLDRERECV